MPNRAAFGEALRAALSGGGDAVGVLYLDLDQFKAVNDTWGHSSGDELLVAVAGRLRGALRGSDVVARLGGDEFGILVAAAPDPDGPLQLAERILQLFEAPFALSETTVSIRASIGIVVGEAGDEGVHLLRQADIAMYDAKRQGGGRWQRFTDTHELIADRYRLANELEVAIDAGELVLHYQPIVDLDSGAIVAAEALVRWQHPEHGLLKPDAFIPVAESSGLIARLDRWVLRAAMEQARTWLDAGIWRESGRIHVNVAPGDLEDPEIVGVVADTLRETRVPAGVLALEVTESALLEVEVTRRHIEEIARLGVSLSLDDFGTRYAVLATLADLPFTTLKIDRAFVLALENPARARLFEGIVKLAERLGLDPLAEGIETEQQRSLVRAHGCRLAQGFLLGRPMPAADLASLLTPAGLPGILRLAAAV
jgi:diguanylate cyclase (GGDEF)-like protein